MTDAAIKQVRGKRYFKSGRDAIWATEEGKIISRLIERELGFVPSDPTEEISAWSNYQKSAGSTPASPPESEPTDVKVAERWRAYQTFSAPQPYGVQRKIVSPLLKEFFYKRERDERATTAISVDEVFNAVISHLEAFMPVESSVVVR